MVRFLGFLVGLGFVFVAGWSLLWGAIAFIGNPPEQNPLLSHLFNKAREWGYTDATNPAKG